MIFNRLRNSLRRAVTTGGLEASRMMQKAGLMTGARGIGAIFTLHHVRPRIDKEFAPNAHLEVTPEFLDAALTQLTSDGYRFLALSDLPAYLAAGDFSQPVAIFTLDDGYRNNVEHAQPVFTRHRVPFTLFVTGGFTDKTHTLWWETLAELLGTNSEITFDFGEGERLVPLHSSAERQAAFDRFASHIATGDEAQAVEALNRAARRYRVDPDLIVERLTLHATELQTLLLNPLASLGGHTITHRALARLTEDEALGEITGSLDRIEAITGQRPTTFAYPYGDHRAGEREYRLARQVGVAVAVTTHPGVLTGKVTEELTALPRISLNGYYQTPETVSALASGIPFRLRKI